MVYYTQKKNFDQLLTWDFLCSQNATNQSKSVQFIYVLTSTCYVSVTVTLKLVRTPLNNLLRGF